MIARPEAASQARAKGVGGGAARPMGPGPAREASSMGLEAW
jgi:hypothetical protein